MGRVFCLASSFAHTGAHPIRRPLRTKCFGTTGLLSASERAALALTEAVTRLSDRSDLVPDEIWKEAARHYDERALASLVLWIGTTNVWNRLNVATDQVAGEWAKSDEAREWRNKQVAAD